MTRDGAEAVGSRPVEGAELLASPVRRRLVDTLSARGALSAQSLAEVVGLHVTTVRFHLDRLVDGGLLETSVGTEDRVGRPSKLYAVAPGSLEVTRLRGEGALHTLTALLTESFGGDADGQAISPQEAGRRWAHVHVPADTSGPAQSPGRWLAKLGAMADALVSWGYQPELSTASGGRTVKVTLDHCPFLDLARSHPAVVCGIHRGLLQGALEQVGEASAEVSLEPFVTPTRCLAHVSTKAVFPGA